MFRVQLVRVTAANARKIDEIGHTPTLSEGRWALPRDQPKLAPSQVRRTE
jgi:hypothetical protein